MSTLPDYPVNAEDFIDVLLTAVPELRFHAYTSYDNEHLYICGFLLEDILIGCYTLPLLQTDLHFAAHCLNLTLFFQKAWSGEAPRFFPTEVQALYEVQRESNELWQRLA